MRYSRLIFIVILILVISACAPAAAPSAPAPTVAPTAAPAAAGPTSPPLQPPAAAQATTVPLPTQGQPELRPPISGGLLNPPTPAPTVPGTQPDTAQLTGWQTFQDSRLGLSFKYPPGWQAVIRWYDPGAAGSVERIEVAPLARSAGSSAPILIDLRLKRGDLLAWLQGQLVAGGVMLGQSGLESQVASYNARLSSYPAIFVYAPESGSGIPGLAEVHVGDNQYFYQFTYVGSTPDSLSNRAIYLQLLGTVALTGTLPAAPTLPPTVFTQGVNTSLVTP